MDTYDQDLIRLRAARAERAKHPRSKGAVIVDEIIESMDEFVDKLDGYIQYVKRSMGAIGRTERVTH